MGEEGASDEVRHELGSARSGGTHGLRRPALGMPEQEEGGGGVELRRRDDR